MEDCTRRRFLQTLAVLGSTSVVQKALGQQNLAQANTPEPYPSAWLPAGIRSRFVEDINGLRTHVLEAGFESQGRPALLLVHGFPELAYSWRKVMVPLAEAGYHVIAPDLRGYGRTTGWNSDYESDLAPFRILNRVRDLLGLVYAFGYSSTAAVIGHDYGSPVAAWCAITRPETFRSVVLMSSPFSGTPIVPSDAANAGRLQNDPNPLQIHEDLARLPRPRKHYQRYYTTREANEDMWYAPQSVHAFLRGYYHYKSADWVGNNPYQLAGRTAQEWAKMPTYYIMDLDKNMAETVAEVMPSAAEIAANQWLPDRELNVYAEEYGRTGFQGGLNGYRLIFDPTFRAEIELYAGRTINQPSMFISGVSDWGTYQNPGAFETMQAESCTDMRSVHLVPGAGHWVQQEQPGETSRLLLEFLGDLV